MQTPRSVEEGDEGLQAPELGFSADHGEAAVPLQPLEVLRDAESCLQPMEKTHARAMVAQQEDVTPWEACTGALSGTYRRVERGAHTRARFL